MSESGSGYLRLRVTSAGGALPVSGAVVTVSEYTPDGTGEVLYSLRTNEGGLTDTVALPTVPAADSMKPGAERPYSVYSVVVKKDGYYTVEGVAVPIFDKIVALQPVNMIPLTESEQIAGATGNSVMIYETPDSETLQPGGLMREDVGNSNGGMTGRNNGGDERGGAD